MSAACVLGGRRAISQRRAGSLTVAGYLPDRRPLSRPIRRPIGAPGGSQPARPVNLSSCRLSALLLFSNGNLGL